MSSMFFSLILAISTAVFAGEIDGRYADAQSKEIITKMVEAHGGLEKFNQAKTLSYDHIMWGVGMPDKYGPWWVSKEVIEQGSRRVYQDWLWNNAKIAWDGEKVFSEDWARLNPPKMMAHIHYYFIALPWATQDPGVHLSSPEKAKLPEGEKEMWRIRMSFEKGVGQSSDDYYLLYIDPETYLIAGVGYTVTDGAFLDRMKMPAEIKSIGPMTHVYRQSTEIEGLIFPVKYKTFSPDGKVMGRHLVINYALNKPFDETRMTMTPKSVIDDSSAERQAQADH